MGKIGIPLFFFLLMGLFCQQSLAINYFRCEKTSDCVKAYGGCGRYLCVHKRYKELYEAKAHKSDKTSFCLPPGKEDRKRKHEGVVKCLNKRCRLLLPKADTNQ